jgi:hypothetical protein
VVNPNLPAGQSPSATDNSNLPNGAPHSVYSPEAEAPPQRLPLLGVRLWAHRLGVLLFVFFCAVLGIVLVVFPWREEWTSNSLLVGYPILQDFLSNGFVRGLCSGMGLLDIWIGFSEAVHYHE